MTTYTNYTNLDSHYDRPYEQGDRLVRGWTGEIELTWGENWTTAQQGFTSMIPVAERIFARHNRDDRPDGRICPSMSIGDVIVIGEVAMSVARTGFEVVNLDPADLITDCAWKDIVA